MPVTTKGFIELSKKLKSEYGDDCARYTTLRISQFAEKEASKNMKELVYDKSTSFELTGRALRGFINRSYFRGLTRQIAANPQLAGAKFNYSQILDKGRRGTSYKGTKFFQKAIILTRKNTSKIAKETIKKLWPR